MGHFADEHYSRGEKPHIENQKEGWKMLEMTPLEAGKLADALEEQLPPKVSYANLVGAESCYGDTYVWEDPEPYMIYEAIQYLRKIASGEYAPVVHAHITGHGYDLHCSNCGASADIGKKYCPSCGALMGGKDDSRE